VETGIFRPARREGFLLNRIVLFRSLGLYDIAIEHNHMHFSFLLGYEHGCGEMFLGL
jgi:hypothetical protein